MSEDRLAGQRFDGPTARGEPSNLLAGVSNPLSVSRPLSDAPRRQDHRILPGTAQQSLDLIGDVEIAAGLLVALGTRVCAFVVAGGPGGIGSTTLHVATFALELGEAIAAQRCFASAAHFAMASAKVSPKRSLATFRTRE